MRMQSVPTQAWLLEAIIVAMELYLEEAEATVVTVAITITIKYKYKYKYKRLTGDVQRPTTGRQWWKSSASLLCSRPTAGQEGDQGARNHSRM